MSDIHRDHVDLFILRAALRSHLAEAELSEERDPCRDSKQELDVIRQRTHQMLTRLEWIADEEQTEAAWHNQLFRRTS